MKKDIAVGDVLTDFFKFKKNNTDLKTEIIAGITTFSTMAYIVAVIPNMLSSGGIPKDTAFTVTLLMTIITTFAIGIYTNRPFALGPGLGSVAIFSYTLLQGGVPLGVATGIVFFSGVVFMFVSFFGVRDFIVRVIPANIKIAIGAGIGLFIALLGFKQSGIIVADSGKNVLVFGNLASPESLLAIVGFFLVIFFVARNIKWGVIAAILIITVIGIPLGITKLPNSIFSLPASIEPMFLKIDFFNSLNIECLPYFLAFFIPDFFSTLGTLLGVGGQAGFLDKDGNLPGIEQCFYVDSLATTFGSFFSCPCLTTYLESSAGVQAGGRTGMTSIVTALLFALTLLFSPIATMIPTAATAPVLMYIGISMLSSIRKLDFSDTTEYMPALICIVFTIFTFNAGNGIAAALLIYAFMKIATGKFKEMHWSLYLTALLMLYYFYIIATT